MRDPSLFEKESIERKGRGDKGWDDPAELHQQMNETLAGYSVRRYKLQQEDSGLSGKETKSTPYSVLRKNRRLQVMPPGNHR